MFIKSYKPTSPVKRHIKSIDNNYLPILKKKYTHRCTFKNKRGALFYKKSNNVPSRRYYKLQKKIPFLCNSTTIVSVNKVKQGNYFVSSYLTGEGIEYVMKSTVGNSPLGFLDFKFFFKDGLHSNIRGYRDSIINFKTGSVCYSLRLLSHHKWVISESAGTFCKIFWHREEDSLTAINTPTKHLIKVSSNNYANFGRVSNTNQNKVKHGTFVKGKVNGNNRVSVRGVAMNPVDHPNGGRTNTKRPLKNPWSRPAKKGK